MDLILAEGTFQSTSLSTSLSCLLFLSQDLASRVMDLILAEGTIFIFQMGMAILKMSALDLLTLDMELMIRVSRLYCDLS